MSKRRVFDIGFPDGEPAEAEVRSVRRGPMATAIGENADALSERQATESLIREENDRLAHELVRLREAGLITEEVPVDEVSTDKLTRDRTDKRDPELDELKASIRDVGLSNPIRVEVVDGGYQLVQGFRRLSAFRELYAETGDAAYARIPAGLIAHGEALEALYRKMVDENMVRRDISFAEMADLARKYSANPETKADSVAEAISVLFASAGRQKRNYIGHFASLLDRIGDDLVFPEAIPRSLGLSLEKRMASDLSLVRSVRARLSALPVASAAKEIEILRGFTAPPSEVAQKTEHGSTKKPSAKTSLRFEGPGGMVRCTATEGKLEIRADTDFASLDRRDLEAALEAFFQTLEG